MQRIHCWLDQLTLRRSRRNRESSRRVASKSVAPSCRLNSEQPKRELKPVAVPTIFAQNELKKDIPMNGSVTRRRGIRTNPWIYAPTGNSSLRGCPQSSLLGSPLPSLDSFNRAPLSLDRRRPPPSLGVKSLEESTCSSGYGSQDCSPDSSVHLPGWQSASPESADVIDDGCYLEDTSSFSTYDNVCDEHIYHELECSRRLERSYSSDELSCAASPSASRIPSPIYNRPESPIYAQPWTHYPRIQAPLVVRNQSFRRTLPERPPSPIYASPYVGPMARPYVVESHVYPKSYFNRLAPVPPPRFCSPTVKENEASLKEKNLEDVEKEFLDELDAQIEELQLRSDELRNMVERARARRQTKWSRPSMECTFELAL